MKQYFHMLMRAGIALSFFSSISCFAMNIRGGSISWAGLIEKENISLRAREECDFTGQALGEKIECTSTTFSGDGFFKAKKINIVTKDFEFTGVIECDEECHITTSKPFDHSMCTFQGNGRVEFSVDESIYELELSKTIELLPKSPTEKKELSRISTIEGKGSQQKLIKEIVHSTQNDSWLYELTENEVLTLIKEVKHCIKKNSLSPKKVRKEVIAALDDRMNDIKNSLLCSRSIQAAGWASSIAGTAGLLWVGIKTGFDMKKASGKAFIAFGLGVLSTIIGKMLIDANTPDISYRAELYNNLVMLKNAFEEKL